MKKLKYVVILGIISSHCFTMEDKSLNTNFKLFMALMLNNSTLPFPENSEQLFKHSVPSSFEWGATEWKGFAEQMRHYPMKLSFSEESKSVVMRNASLCGTSFISSWNVDDFTENQIAPHLRNMKSLFRFSHKLNEQKENTDVYLQCWIKENNWACVEFVPICVFRFALCNRMNTSSGSPPLPVTNASFGANFWGDGHQDLYWIIGNICARIHSPNNIVTNDELVRIANQISALFDPPPATASKAKPETLQLTTSPNQPDTVRVSVLTPAGSPYADWWLRLDTTAGALSVTEPGKAILSNIPKEGATLTTYAISPDGKEWRYTTLEIPATKK